jgi:hypothetical protein
VSSGKKGGGKGPTQLELELVARPRARAPVLRVVPGGGQRREERLTSRDAVVRVLLEAGADLLLRRISSARAEDIERRVDQVLTLFDRVDATPALLPLLQRHLDELEALMRQTRETRGTRRGRCMKPG